MRSAFEWIAKIIVWVVALMSGILSLFREATALYLGDKAPPRSLFERSVIIAFIVSAAIAWGQERYARAKEGKAYDAFRKGLPRFVVDTGAFYETTRYTIIRGARLAGSATMTDLSFRLPTERRVAFSCLVLRITNDPLMPATEAEARNVTARMNFRTAEGKTQFSLDGRWSDSTQPPNLAPNQVPYELRMADFPIGAERELDIAIKYQDEEFAYAVNNDSYGYELLKKPDWRLPPGDYVVELRLRGIIVDQKWVLRLRNPAGPAPLEALSIEGA